MPFVFVHWSSPVGEWVCNNDRLNMALQLFHLKEEATNNNKKTMHQILNL